MDLKKLTENLIKQEFGELVLSVQFKGPFEEEELDVDVTLKEFPEDLSKRSYTIYSYLWDRGFDVLIGYHTSADEIEAAMEEYIERQEKDVKAASEKISETLRRLRETDSKMERKTIEVDGIIVDGKLTLSLQNDSGRRIKVNGNEIITPYERIVVNIKP